MLPYEDAWHLQCALRRARLEGAAGDTLLLVQHPPTITVGRSGDVKNLLVGRAELLRRGIELVAVDRGGDITYHGPGQLVAYPIFYVRRLGLTVSMYVRKLEEVVMFALKDLGIDATSIPGQTGVWVEKHKIASIGVRVSRGVTTHGCALNVNNDLSPFQYMHPCGNKGTKMTSVATLLGEGVRYRNVEDLVARHFRERFDMKTFVLDEL